MSKFPCIESRKFFFYNYDHTFENPDKLRARSVINCAGADLSSCRIGRATGFASKPTLQQTRWETFNCFNAPEFNNASDQVGQSGFGVVNKDNSRHEIKLSLEFYF